MKKLPSVNFLFIILIVIEFMIIPTPFPPPPPPPTTSSLAKNTFLNLLFTLFILTLLDFPEPIKESIKVLRDHIYIPLSDVQIAK
ncbi:MAG: hypothetical protein MJE68_18055, partial [Proteobacteria bacterium]|nr:hypothetical protein [Pseudomonadota bacterium]